MNKRVLLCLLLLFFFLCFTPTAKGLNQADLPQMGSAAAVLMEVHSGTLLFSVNGDQALPPASTTKICTALLALELAGDLDRDYQISEKAAAVEESSIYLQAGEFLSLRELLQGALVHSGNDACYAIGEAIAGSEPLFVHWLNQKAAAMGAYSLNFQNTNGLPAEGHVVSGEDLLRITAKAMEYPFFAETVASKYTSLGEGEHYRYFRNTNKLLWQDEHVVGIKTGTTDAAGPCLVSGYEQGMALFLALVFNSPDRYGESMTLLRYGADNYVLAQPLLAGEKVAWKEGCFFAAGQDLQALVETTDLDRLSLRWYLPDDQGLYRVELCLDGEVLAETPLLKMAQTKEEPEKS